MVRLDCQQGNEKLKAFYEEVGYRYVGTTVAVEYEGFRREKQSQQGNFSENI